MRLTHIHKPFVVNEFTGTLSKLLGSAQLGLARNSTVTKLLDKYPSLNKLVDRSKYLSGSLLHPDYAKWWFNLTAMFGVPAGEKGEVVDTLIGRISPRINRAREKVGNGKNKEQTINKTFGSTPNFGKGGLRKAASKIFGGPLGRGHLGRGKIFRNSTESDTTPISEKLSDVDHGWLDMLSPTRRKQIKAAQHRRINNERIALMAIKLLFDEYGETPLKQQAAQPPGQQQKQLAGPAKSDQQLLSGPEDDQQLLSGPASQGPSPTTPGALPGGSGGDGKGKQKPKPSAGDPGSVGKVSKLIDYLDKATPILLKNAKNPKVGRFITMIIAGLESTDISDEYMPLLRKLGSILRTVLKQQDLPDSYRQYYSSLIPRMKELVKKSTGV